jgi:hypothetical protein
MRTFVQKYVYLLLFHRNNGSVNVPHFYVIRTLRVLFFSTATMVTRTRLSNTFICTLPVCFILTYKSFRGNSFLCAYEIVVFRELNIYVTVLCGRVYSLMLIIHNVVKKNINFSGCHIADLNSGRGSLIFWKPHKRYVTRSVLAKYCLESELH